MTHPHGLDPDNPSGRRAFLGKLAATAAAGAAGLTLTSALDPDALSAATATTAPDAEHWLDNLKAKHRQLVDAYEPNDGWPLGFAHTFLVAQTPPDSGGAVIVLRHVAMPLALTHEVWARYKIGESLKINDPATKQPAVKNPYFKPAKGVLLDDNMAVDRLIARGAIIGACNVALHVFSGMLAGNAGVSKEAAAKEWTAGLIPGITVLPSGTWGVNRAQEKGCTYCTGGG